MTSSSSSRIATAAYRLGRFTGSMADDAPGLGTQKYGNERTLWLKMNQIPVYPPSTGDYFQKIGVREEEDIGLRRLQAWLDQHYGKGIYTVKRPAKEYDECIECPLNATTPDFDLIENATGKIWRKGETKAVASAWEASQVPKDDGRYRAQCEMEAVCGDVPGTLLCRATETALDVIEHKVDKKAWLAKHLPMMASVWKRGAAHLYGYEPSPCFVAMLEDENRRRPPAFQIDIKAALARRVSQDRIEQMQRYLGENKEFKAAADSADIKTVPPRFITANEKQFCAITADDVEGLARGKSFKLTRTDILKRILGAVPRSTSEGMRERMAGAARRRQLYPAVKEQLGVDIIDEFKVQRNATKPWFVDASSVHMADGGIVSSVRDARYVAEVLPWYITMPAIFRRDCVGLTPVRVFNCVRGTWREEKLPERDDEKVAEKMAAVFREYLAFFYTASVSVHDERSERNVLELLGDTPYTRFLLRQRYVHQVA